MIPRLPLPVKGQIKETEGFFLGAMGRYALTREKGNPEGGHAVCSHSDRDERVGREDRFGTSVWREGWVHAEAGS